MTSLLLKIIACITMLIDHIGYMNDNLLFRLVGRISFPLFSFMLVEGYRKTSSKPVYFCRLALSAIISELAFNYCFSGTWIHLGSTSVMVTLLLGFASLILLDSFLNTKNPFMLFLCAFPVAAAEILSSDYELPGVLLIMLMFVSTDERLFPTDKILGKLALSTSVIIFSLRYLPNIIRDGSSWGIITFFSALSLFPILAYNGKRGYTPKSPMARKAIQYLFYLFYPAHLFILGFL